ncbi:hypothetical protein PR202_gb20143 [Eleusine coracana subsp. coracana]|uniref:PIPK domain-containing protein n=1 Tax=Eleusine coracana subsp. coracana TaxID=191504 RepID=A0AAV5F9Z1_ELECO|nr:hypothetical protein PR202_gb20143 [Eleusine coracana subsp. coracana]
MDASDKTFSDVVKLLTSWLPRRSNQDNVSRDFWMPDHSCRSSYNACLIPISSFDIRSDDEDEEYAGYCSDRHGQHGQHNEQYYGPDEFDELDRSCNSATSQTVEENIISKEIAACVIDQGFLSTLPVMKPENDLEPDNSSECGAASSIYAPEGTDINQVDFEKNELFWLPPEPEDEEDEMEGGLFFEDDDDELLTDGEQCRIRSPSSFGSGEFRSKDRSSEEHKKVMKNVVDGHFRALISQLLQVENISLNEGDNMGWLEIVTLLSWEAANFLRPDTSQSGGMDPGGYVKVKCLACGHRSESTVVKGIVCKKNVAHRRMTSRIEKPRLLLLAGALEYHRVTNQLSSIDTLLQQVLLKGGNMDELKKIKHVVQYGIFAAYHLALETSFLADEGATLLELPLKSSLTVALPDKRSAADSSISIVPGFTINVSNSQQMTDSFGHVGSESIISTWPSGTFDNGSDIGPAEVTTAASSVPVYVLQLHLVYSQTMHLSHGHMVTTDSAKTLSHHQQTMFETTNNIVGYPKLKEPLEDSNDLANVKTASNDNVLVVQPVCSPAVQNQESNQGHDGTSNKEEVLASDHQSILVSWSTRCVWKGTICERSQLLRIKYYGNFDKPLGRFLRDYLFDQGYQCRSCDKPPEAHVHCYTHRQGSLTISVIDRAKHLFDEVFHTLHPTSDKKGNGSLLNLESSNYIAELDSILRKEKSEFEGCLNKVLKREMLKGQPDILEINRVRRQLLFRSYLWDKRLAYAAKTDRNRHELHSFKQGDYNSNIHSVYSVAEPNGITKLQIENTGNEAADKDILESIYAGNCHAVDANNANSNHDWQTATSEPNCLERDIRTLYSSISVSAESVPMETDLVSRRTLSEGQFPSILDVTNALEMKWTGKDDPISSKSTILSSVVPSEDSEEQLGDITPSYATILLNKLGDSADDNSNWIPMPFLQFYRSLNKQWNRSNRFDALNEYSHVYIPFLREVERQIGPKFLFPIGINDTVVGVYDDEPTSIISYALVSHEYHIQLSDELERETIDTFLPLSDSRTASLTESLDETTSELLRSVVSTEDNILSMSGSKNMSTSDSLGYRKVNHIKVKSLKGGKEMKMDVLVMENLLFERHVTRLYDLKGSTRSRYNPDSNGSDKVLLDQNLIEAMPTSPIFVGNKAKRLLERAVWNDTAFLASIDVMDYSLLVGVDERRHELVMGIIDFMRQYTWDKHLETWVKASGILGGPKNVSPTVISPKQYKKRFRKAMSAYFLVVPDQWSPPVISLGKQVTESGQDSDQFHSMESRHMQNL